MMGLFRAIFKAPLKTAGATAGAAAIIGSGFVFSERSKQNLYEVCPPLIRVSECAIKKTDVDKKNSNNQK